MASTTKQPDSGAEGHPKDAGDSGVKQQNPKPEGKDNAGPKKDGADTDKGAEKPPVAPTMTVSELFDKERPDPNRLTLTTEPNVSPLRTGTKVTLIARAKQGGYLTLIEQDEPGVWQKIFPADGKTALQVSAENPIRISFKQSAPGQNRVKAWLFAKPDGVNALLQAFGADGSFKEADFRRQASAAKIPLFSCATAALTLTFKGSAAPLDFIDRNTPLQMRQKH